MDKKGIIEAGSIFVTQRTREAIHKTAEQRTNEEIKEYFTILRDSMDEFCKRIAVEEISGKDIIIYTPERKIGKTEAALYLANEYKMPYLVKREQTGFVKVQARTAGYNINFIILDNPQTELRGLRTVLKDECLKVKEARKCIGEHINIIGIEEI